MCVTMWQQAVEVSKTICTEDSKVALSFQASTELSEAALLYWAMPTGFHRKGQKREKKVLWRDAIG